METRHKVVADEEVLALCMNPRRQGVEALQGGGLKLFRKRFANDYRIVFSVDPKENAIVVMRISHRREVYR